MPWPVDHHGIPHVAVTAWGSTYMGFHAHVGPHARASVPVEYHTYAHMGLHKHTHIEGLNRVGL
eukprot:4217103-Pyramimonas_sp.AAC.1